jgi:DNA-directed RNA polymerase subunit M/transcription elongation factor TFIIS
MNYKILKDLIAIFKKKLRCNKCNETISNRAIEIEAISKTKVLLKCNCKKCGNTILAEVSIVQETKHKNNLGDINRPHQGLKLKAKKIKTVTPNDILDVKNFLKSFKGDFKQIFRK